MRTFITLLLLTLAWPALALFGQSDNSTTPAFTSKESDFVTVEQAFPFTANQIKDEVYLSWQVKPGYYLYQQRLSISSENAQFAPYELTEAEPYQDEFFGSVNIYTQPLQIKLTLNSVQENARLIVQYQGCAKAGFCYPPETRVVTLQPIGNSSETALPQAAANTEKQPRLEQTPAPVITSNDAQLADDLADNWWTPLAFLALGIGLAFTPCVFPMYPILTSIVLGQGKLTPTRAFGLAMVYVQGMALTYTLLGLVVASAGLQFQAALQHPYVLIALSIIFVLLSLSMFGLYSLQLPSSAQTWLNSLSNKQQGGSMLSVFAMGAISGLVCSPCTTAPLSGALLYVAQSGDLLTGGIALYALGLGMGIPLIIVAVFGNKLLPRAGLWMDRVKIGFGFVLLAAPIFLVERLIPESWSVTLWGLLGLAFFGWLYHLKNSLTFAGWQQSLVGIIAVLGLLSSALPIYHLWFDSSSEQSQPAPQLNFIRVDSVEALEQQLVLANKANKPVLLDFYADWCVACKEFDKYTFHHPDVAVELSKFVLIQADVTHNTAKDIALYKYLKVMGLPTIDFWNSQGEYLTGARLTGFMKATPFLDHLTQHQLLQ